MVDYSETGCSWIFADWQYRNDENRLTFVLKELTPNLGAVAYPKPYLHNVNPNGALVTTHTNKPQHGRDEEINLFEVAVNLWQQKWIIIAITCVSTLLAVAYAFLTTPVYEASARVMPPSANDVLPFNLGRSQAGLTALDVDSAFALFQRNLTSQSTRRWFLEEHYLPYRREQGDSSNRDALAQQMAEVLMIRRPDERNNPSVYEVTVNVDQPELAALWANSYVEQAAARSRRNLEARTNLEIANRRTELQNRINVVRTSTLDQRKDRIARLKEALQIAEAVGFDSPQITRGQTAADGDLSQIIDGNLLYMRGSRAIRAELELLENRKDDDPFIIELRAIEQQIGLLDLVGPVPETVQLYTLDSVADVPERPIKPNKSRIIILGALFGGMIGGLIALTRTQSRRREPNQGPLASHT